MTIQVDWEQGIDWATVRQYRIQRVVEAIRRAGLDAVMYTRLDAIRYITSFRPVISLWFHGTRHVVFVTADGHIKFLVASGDLDRVKATMPWLTDYEPFPFLAGEGVGIVERAIQELKLSKACIGTDMLPFSLYAPLRERFPAASFVDGLPVIEEARRVKHPDEIKVIRRAAEVADIGMQTALAAVAPGVTEHEISAKAAYAMLLQGSEHMTYLPLVESGEHGWLGYRFPTDKRIRPGEMVYIDCGTCIINGYNGDIARTTVVGRPTEEQKRIYRCMYDMLQAGTEALRPGVATTEVVAAIQKSAKTAGYWDYTYFGIVGHGIGTDLHEAPVIGEKVVESKEVAVLMENEVVCLEPGVLVPGVGGGHVEDMILITKHGVEPLTKTPFDERLL